MLYFTLTCLLSLSVWSTTEVFGQKIALHQNDNLPPTLVKEPVDSFSSNANHQRSANSEKQDLTSASHLAENNFLPGLKKSALRTTRIKRAPTGFTARGLHEDIFDRDFGHFSPVKRTQKRRPEADAAGFYGDTFSGGFGEFETMKKSLPLYLADKRLSTLIKRRPEMGAQGFHGDTFSSDVRNLLEANKTTSCMLVLCGALFIIIKTNHLAQLTYSALGVAPGGFGEFDTMKRSYPYNNWADAAVKRRPEMTKSGFHGDVFNSGFGEFHPMKK